MSKKEVAEKVVSPVKNDVREWTIESLESMAYKTLRSIKILQNDLATIENEIVRREQGVK